MPLMPKLRNLPRIPFLLVIVLVPLLLNLIQQRQPRNLTLLLLGGSLLLDGAQSIEQYVLDQRGTGLFGG